MNETSGLGFIHVPLCPGVWQWLFVQDSWQALKPCTVACNCRVAGQQPCCRVAVNHSGFRLCSRTSSPGGKNGVGLRVCVVPAGRGVGAEGDCVRARISAQQCQDCSRSPSPFACKDPAAFGAGQMPACPGGLSHAMPRDSAPGDTTPLPPKQSH